MIPIAQLSNSQLFIGLLFAPILFLLMACNAEVSNTKDEPEPKVRPLSVGAEQMDTYVPMLKGKRVGLIVNQTSMVNGTHLVDTLLAQGVEIVKIFAPEHGFRGTASAGEKIIDGKDPKTGLPIVSLYGSNKKPTPQQIGDLDIVVFDIQDVGTRFYTYISTMHLAMEACAEMRKSFMVLDRPNPNGHYVDGPVLDMAYQSFIGMHPIPVVHGLTVGELAQMINGEKWLKNGVQCQLNVVLNTAYNHQMDYELPIKPSPNLPNSQAIELYPSLCFFEGTVVSVGRGTEFPFQVVGSPAYKGQYSYSFTPTPNEGAKYPKHQHETCYGKNFSQTPIQQHQIELSYLLEFYQNYRGEKAFFLVDMFDKLAGTSELRKAIMAGKTEEEIRSMWKKDLDAYKMIRQHYLLYD